MLGWPAFCNLLPNQWKVELGAVAVNAYLAGTAFQWMAKENMSDGIALNVASYAVGRFLFFCGSKFPLQHDHINQPVTVFDSVAKVALCEALGSIILYTASTFIAPDSPDRKRAVLYIYSGLSGVVSYGIAKGVNELYQRCNQPPAPVPAIAPIPLVNQSLIPTPEPSESDEKTSFEPYTDRDLEVD